jgi:hypothetical protein
MWAVLLGSCLHDCNEVSACLEFKLYTGATYSFDFECDGVGVRVLEAKRFGDLLLERTCALQSLYSIHVKQCASYA